MSVNELINKLFKNLDGNYLIYSEWSMDRTINDVIIIDNINDLVLIKNKINKNIEKMSSNDEIIVEYEYKDNHVRVYEKDIKPFGFELQIISKKFPLIFDLQTGPY